MKRRTLDIAFSIGGALFAVLLLVLGLVLRNEANFAKSYVHDQLIEQKITFQAAKTLDAEMSKVPCLVEYGTTNGDNTKGQTMSTGKMAECYSNEYIATHMKAAAKGAGYEGATYSTMGAYTMAGTPVSLVDALAAAKKGGDQTKIDAATADLAKATGLRSTLQTGETLRGLLLTTYGFSIFGEKANLAATVCYLAFALLLLLSIFGLVHAFFSKHAKDVLLAVEHKTEA